MLDDGNDFSFSGLKTAVVQYVRKHPDADVADVAASFQAAVVDVLVDQAAARARERDRDRHGRDRRRRRRELRAARPAGRRGRGRRGLRVVLPSIALCTDNAAMVAAVAACRLAADGPTPSRRRRTPCLPLGSPSAGGLPWCRRRLVPLALDVWEC